MIVGHQAGEREGFSFLTEIPLGRLTTFAKPRQFPEGSEICDGAELSGSAWFILSGSCELRRMLPDGTEEVLTTYVPGEVFGKAGKETCDSQLPVSENRQASSVKPPEISSEDKRTEPRVRAVATTDSVLLCFDRTTLEMLRMGSEGNGNGQHERGNGNGHGEFQGRPGGRPSDDRSTPPFSARQDRDRQALPHSGRIASKLVSLAFVSDDLPEPLIATKFARSLHAETGQEVVCIRVAGFGTGNVSGSGRGRAGEAVPKQIEEGIFGLELNPAYAGPALDRLLSGAMRPFPYVLVEASASVQGEAWLRGLLVRSDAAYVFLSSGAGNVRRLAEIARDTRLRGRNQAAQLKPIGCLKQGENPDGFDMLAENAGVPLHSYIRGCPRDRNPNEAGDGQALSSTDGGLKPIFTVDIRRLAREAGGCLIGLALSSGAAKGFAHIGVIQVLEENGIEVDVVAGASMGAYVGSIWAHGHPGPELERLAREVEGRWKFWSLVDPIFPPRQGFLRGFAIKRRLERSLGNARFIDLVRPMRVVATNLITLERKVFSAGQVSTAVHASIAVPGICVPVTIDGDTYIDGGIMDPLPVEVLREMGAARVIAVDTIPTPATMRHAAELEAEKEKRARNIFRKAISIDKQLNYFARGNLFEILMRSVHGAQIRAAEASCRQADVVLRPDILDDRWLDFRHPGKFITLGREVALRHLDELRAITVRKNRKEPAYERAGNTMAAVA